MSATGSLSELQGLCPEAVEMQEGCYRYIYLPALRVRSGEQVLVLDALLCPQPKDGYASRLYLSQQISGRGANWKAERILDRTWWTWSWNGVGGDLRPVEILAEHLRALR
jgi:hypothetical protein